MLNLCHCIVCTIAQSFLEDQKIVPIEDIANFPLSKEDNEVQGIENHKHLVIEHSKVFAIKFYY